MSCIHGGIRELKAERNSEYSQQQGTQKGSLPHCQSWVQLLGDGVPTEKKTPPTLLQGDEKGGKA